MTPGPTGPAAASGAVSAAAAAPRGAAAPRAVAAGTGAEAAALTPTLPTMAAAVTPTLLAMTAAARRALFVAAVAAMRGLHHRRGTAPAVPRAQHKGGRFGPKLNNRLLQTRPAGTYPTPPCPAMRVQRRRRFRCALVRSR